MRNIPQEGEMYRHFKGNEYQIVAIAEHSEDGSQMVVYKALYGEGKCYVRPLDMFMEEVDREKYPDVTQKYRFEKVESQVSPQMMAYLEADTYKEKLDIVMRMRDILTEDMIYTMAMAHDISLCEGDMKKKYDSLCSALKILAKYDGQRLR